MIKLIASFQRTNHRQSACATLRSGIDYGARALSGNSCSHIVLLDGWFQVVGSTPDQLAAAIKSDVTRMGKVITDARMRID